MAYEVVPFSGFGKGLNLRDRVDTVSDNEAVDCLNVEFSERGAVRQRKGYDNFTGGAESYGTLVLSHSPALFWRCNEAAGTTAEDASPNNVDGTYTGSVTLQADGALEDDADKAADLNGGYITSAYSPFAAGSTRTFLGWAKRDSSTTIDALFGSSATSGHVQCRILASSRTVSFIPQANVGSATSWTLAWPAGTGDWTFWVLTFNETANTVELWIDAISQGQRTQATNYHAAPGTFVAGARSNGQDPFDGKVDEIAVIEGSLTQAQINQIYSVGQDAPLNRPQSLAPYYTSTGTRQLVAGCGTRLEVIDNAGSVTASQTGATDGIWDFTRFGAPGSELLYAGQGNEVLRKWDGTTWASVDDTPKAGALAVMAVERGNRMVAGRFHTSDGGPTGETDSSNPSRVYFSDPGDPESWGENNYIDFYPGDGEKVQAIVTWREKMLIFKQTKFFVIHGSSEDMGGQPIFNWQAVDTGVGLASPRAVAVAPNGVYFMSRDGVYFTDGFDPVRVSDVIDPIWTGQTSEFYLGGTLAHVNITNCAMHWHGERLYLSFPTTSDSNRVLVFDPRYEWWSLWDLPASCFASFRIGNKEELVFGDSIGANHVHRHSSAYTNDNGEAITSRWRSGWSDYGLSIVKTIRESKAWGSGIVDFSVSYDFKQSVGTQTSVSFVDTSGADWGSFDWGDGTDWATPDALNAALRRLAVRGTVFSTSLENSTLDQEWSVHRLEHHLRESRVPSMTTA